mgnify:CR=1 FL=1
MYDDLGTIKLYTLRVQNFQRSDTEIMLLNITASKILALSNNPKKHFGSFFGSYLLYVKMHECTTVCVSAYVHVHMNIMYICYYHSFEGVYRARAM